VYARGSLHGGKPKTWFLPKHADAWVNEVERPYQMGLSHRAASTPCFATVVKLGGASEPPATAAVTAAALGAGAHTRHNAAAASSASAHGGELERVIAGGFVG
jgi:hypothetical protein